MSCQACDDNTEPPVFYRWRTANIGVSGCDMHVREVFAMLNHVQQSLGQEEMKKIFEPWADQPLVKVKQP